MGKIHLLFFCDLRACMHACEYHATSMSLCRVGAVSVLFSRISRIVHFFLRAQNFTLVFFPIYVCRVYVTCFCVVSPLARKT